MWSLVITTDICWSVTQWAWPSSRHRGAGIVPREGCCAHFNNTHAKNGNTSKLSTTKNNSQAFAVCVCVFFVYVFVFCVCVVCVPESVLVSDWRTLRRRFDVIMTLLSRHHVSAGTMTYRSYIRNTMTADDLATARHRETVYIYGCFSFFAS